MTVSIFTSLLIYSFITAFTPGPNNILALGSAVTFGMRASRPLLWGNFFGFLLVLTGCGAATSSLMVTLPRFMQWITYAGAAYILWMALNLVRASSKTNSMQAKPYTFMQGLVLQFMNVKFILYGITAFSIFVLPYTQDLSLILGIGLLLAGMASVSNWVWALAGKLCQALFQKHGRLINWILAGTLVYCVVTLLRDMPK